MTEAVAAGDTRIKSVAILGTCVSRDMIRIATGESVKVKKYLARGTVRSILAKSPGKLSYGDPSDLSGFERRNFDTDIAKSAFRQLSTVEADLCIVDMIDERLATWNNGETILTNSKGFEVAMGKLPPPWKYRAPLAMRAETLELAPLWAAKLKEAVGHMPIVIHRALWATGGGSDDKTVAEHNAFLDELYDVICAALPEAVAVRADDSVRRAATEHQWGPAPYHYEDPYYGHVWAAITAHFPAEAPSPST
ncbi:DUF6270 domain-containing protein [Ancylobacter oerskovii]|uniref:DUF6270 domain-containing protein n=1 Tax=Ancylobacter oerskovii TaxID=459519 RepID=A0ABW4Z1M0_9HYPH|nr:DUF6270 domain-containing protein [Ancylobacter oerskovii]MBS7545055.1 hypothetical protein [Ancylobacter oerskovii]